MKNNLNMRKKAQEFYGYEIDPEKMFPTFEKEQAIDTVTRWLQGEFSSDQIQDLIVENKLYDYIYYTFIGMYSHLVHKDELSKNVLKQLAREMAHQWEVEGSPLSIPTDIKELTKIDPALQKLLNKYSPDEIFDIAAGRKDATEEEVAQAKEVITRGIVSNRLNMRSFSRKLLIKDRIKLAEEPSTPPETLAELAKDKYMKVRWRVASNPSTPLETLIELSKDEDAYVRCHCGLNPSTPVETLVELSKDENLEVHETVAMNLSTPIETLIELSKDKHFQARQEVALNPSTPIETLTTLSEDKDRGVRKHVAMNKSTPPEILVKLSKDENTSVRINVAENPSTPPETLVELSKDENRFVRRGVANNSNTPSEIQKQIKKEPDYKEEEFDTVGDVYEYYTAGEPKEEDSEEKLEEVVDTDMFKLTPHGIERAPSTKPKKEPISKTPYTEVVEKYTPEILNKYTEGEIFDIAAGRKDATEEEIEQAKDVITRGIVSSRLSMRKKAQSTPETIQKAQAGDENAIAQVIEENMGLISQALIKWGYTPKSDEFEDVMSDIKVEMLNRIIPQYDPSKGAFSTFLSTAVYNFLRRGTREKEYKEKQKEVSLAEPIEEGITIEDTLADPTSEVVQMTLSSARENLQIWLNKKKPDLEEVVLRVFDLKVQEYSHEQIAEALNQEGYTSKGKPFTRTMVNNYVNDWIKPALAQFFEAFKTAKLNMRKRADTAPLSYKKVMDIVMIVKDLQQLQIVDLNKVEEVAENLYNIFGDETLMEDILDVREDRASVLIKIIGDYLTTLDKDELEYSAKEILESLIKVCQDPFAPGHQIEKVPLKDVFKTEKEKEEFEDEEEEGEEWKEPKKPLKERIREEMVIPSKEPVSETLLVEELEKYTPEILNKYTADEIFDIAAGKKEATEEEVIQAKDVIQRGIVSSRLSMRKKAQKTIHLFHTFTAKEWKEEFLQRGITPDDLNDYSETSSPRADKKVILAQAKEFAGGADWGDTNFVILEFVKPLDEVYVDYDEPPDVLFEGYLPEGAITYEKLTNFESNLYGSFVLDIKPDEIVNIYGRTLQEFLGGGSYAVLLNKYTKDEIFDIAAGRKDATEEEVIQSKDVISRGIVSNRLSMRKEGIKADPVDIAKAKSLKTSPEELMELSKNKAWTVCKAVALNPNTPEKILLDLMAHPTASVRQAIAERSNISSDLLSQLVADKSSIVRESVALNVNTSPETLDVLSKDEDITVCWRVADNPNTSPETLVNMSKLDSWEILHSIAQHPNTPESVLEELMLKKDEDRYDLQNSIARNPNIPDHLMNELVREAVRNNNEDLKSALLENPKLPLDILREWTADPELREDVVYNPNAPADILLELAKEAVEKIDYLSLPTIMEHPNYTGPKVKIPKIQGYWPEGIIRDVWQPVVDAFTKEVVPEREEVVEETVEVPYAELLNKYSPDEIFDIAAGRKEATAEEVEQAKDVITRGIIASKLNMRKKMSEYIIPPELEILAEEARKYKSAEEFVNKTIKEKAQKIIDEYGVENYIDDVYLVGSRAKGIAKPTSDYDFVIKVKNLQEVATEEGKFNRGIAEKLANMEEKIEEAFKDFTFANIKTDIYVTPDIEDTAMKLTDFYNQVVTGIEEVNFNEEVAQAKDVIQRGIVSSRLSMRKKGK